MPMLKNATTITLDSADLYKILSALEARREWLEKNRIPGTGNGYKELLAVFKDASEAKLTIEYK